MRRNIALQSKDRNMARCSYNHSMKSVVHAACPHDCPDACGVLITVEDGRATQDSGRSGASGDARISVREGGEVSGPRLFAGARALSHAAAQRRGQGRWQQGRCADFVRITWDEALDEIAARFEQIVAEFGREAILPYSYGGTLAMLNGASMDRRFFHRLGASRLDRTICSAAGGAGLKSRDRREAGHRAGTVSPLAADHRLGRQHSRQQRSPVAVHRGGAPRGRQAGGHRSLSHAHGRAAPTGICPSIPAPMWRWRWR